MAAWNTLVRPRRLGKPGLNPGVGHDINKTSECCTWVASKNRNLCYQVEGAWPEEAIHVKKKLLDRMWSGGAREYYVSEISDRKLP